MNTSRASERLCDSIEQHSGSDATSTSMDSSEDLSSELAELKAIIESIITGRVSPMRAKMLSLRYEDIKGCRFRYEKFSCSSLVEVIQMYLFDAFDCIYMHYYKDYVICLTDGDLARETVIERLRNCFKKHKRPKFPRHSVKSFRNLSSQPGTSH